MADQTNGEVPAAGGQLSGEVSKDAAVKRLSKQPGFRKQQSVGPNTGGTGLPKPEASMVQKPGLESQSATPGHRRI